MLTRVPGAVNIGTVVPGASEIRCYNRFAYISMPSDLPTICDERVRLLRDYGDMAAEYARRVREMVQFAVQGQETESSAGRRLCRAAWEAVESSRLLLSRHEADHACDRTGEQTSSSRLAE